MVDTVGFAVPVMADFDTVGCTRTTSNLGKVGEEGHRYMRRLDGGGFMGFGVGGKAWIEASLPKRAGGENVDGLVLDEALDVMRELYGELSQYADVDPERHGDRFELSKVVRLDVVRDFDGVRDLGYVLDGLAGMQQAGRSKVRRFADGERNLAETLRVGPKAWAATLYDKEAETKGAAPAGRTRFEARLHSEQLRSEWARLHGGMVRQVADLEEFKGRQLTAAMFKRVGFDRKVMASAMVNREIFRPIDPDTKHDERGLSKHDQQGLFVYLLSLEGRAAMSRNTQGKYRRLAGQLGITVDDDGLAVGERPHFLVGLDYERGTQELVAA
jgi:hypothetical protein